MAVDVNKVVNWFRVHNYGDMRHDDNVEALTQMKVMKLLYYAQGIMLAAFDRKLFDNDILAWKYGPVVSEVHDRYVGKREIVDFNADGMESKAIEDFTELQSTDEVSIVLNTVQEAYGDKSAIQLMQMTHNEAPWQTTEQSDVISTDAIKSYFKAEVLAE